MVFFCFLSFFYVIQYVRDKCGDNMKQKREEKSRYKIFYYRSNNVGRSSPSTWSVFPLCWGTPTVAPTFFKVPKVLFLF